MARANLSCVSAMPCDVRVCALAMGLLVDADEEAHCLGYYLAEKSRAA